MSDPVTPKTQKEIFLQSEGDAMWTRALNRRYRVEEMDRLLPFLQPNSKVLEIGCAYGPKLNQFHLAGHQWPHSSCPDQSAWQTADG